MEGGGDGGAGAGAPACAPACAHDHLVLAHGPPEPAQPKRPPLRRAARAGSHAARARKACRGRGAGLPRVRAAHVGRNEDERRCEEHRARACRSP
jgi:hypothetical protein